MGCPGIPQDRLGYVGPYTSGCPGISQDGFEHVGLGTLYHRMSWDILGWVRSVYISGCSGMGKPSLGHVGYRGCPGISQEGFGHVHVGLGTLLWHISQDVLGYPCIQRRGKDSPWHSWTFMNVTYNMMVLSKGLKDLKGITMC